MSRQQKDDRGFVMDNVFEFGAAQVITNPTVSTQTTAFGAQTTTIRVACTGDHVHIAVNSNPTATTSSSILPAGIVEVDRSHQLQEQHRTHQQQLEQ